MLTVSNSNIAMQLTDVKGLVQWKIHNIGSPVRNFFVFITYDYVLTLVVPLHTCVTNFAMVLLAAMFRDNASELVAECIMTCTTIKETSF